MKIRNKTQDRERLIKSWKDSLIWHLHWTALHFLSVDILPTQCGIKDGKRLDLFTSLTWVLYKWGRIRSQVISAFTSATQRTFLRALPVLCSLFPPGASTCDFLTAALSVDPDPHNSTRRKAECNDTIFIFCERWVQSFIFSPGLPLVANLKIPRPTTNTPECYHWQHLFQCSSQADSSWACLHQLKSKETTANLLLQPRHPVSSPHKRKALS